MPHPSDQEFLLDAEGELSPNAAKQIRVHIDSCRTCRARCQDLERAMSGFIRAHHQEMDPQIPPVDSPRALLMARLFEHSAVDYLVTPALHGAARK